MIPFLVIILFIFAVMNISAIIRTPLNIGKSRGVITPQFASGAVGVYLFQIVVSILLVLVLTGVLH